MDDRAASTPPAEQPSSDTASSLPPARRRAADLLRFIPPIAALGTAFVLQVILVTDSLGTPLAKRTASSDWDWVWYLLAGLLGLAVASCIEGGAAYLMDLYDKHLLARDSVWLLRLGMLVYVAGSGAAVHWWTDHRHLPELITWLLAGMSASALFLWSRGSRWKHRVAMRAAGQLDPAMPRQATATKVWHPIRCLITAYLVSWEPAHTTDDARARYEQWRDSPHWWNGRQSTVSAATSANTTATPAPSTAAAAVTEQAEQSPNGSAPSTFTPVRPITSARSRRTPMAAGAPSIEELAQHLDQKFRDRLPGRPTAEAALRAKFGKCSAGRAEEAKNMLARWRTGADTNSEQPTDSDDPLEEHHADHRIPALAGA